MAAASLAFAFGVLMIALLKDQRHWLKTMPNLKNLLRARVRKWTTRTRWRSSAIKITRQGYKCYYSFKILSNFGLQKNESIFLKKRHVKAPYENETFGRTSNSFEPGEGRAFRARFLEGDGGISKISLTQHEQEMINLNKEIYTSEESLETTIALRFFSSPAL